jgi:hypothetical protein
MSIEIDALIDAYTTMKEYVPSKDRQAAADHMFSILNDSGVSEEDLKQVAGTDSYLKRASEEYLDPDSEDLDEDETDYDYGED